MTPQELKAKGYLASVGLKDLNNVEIDQTLAPDSDCLCGNPDIADPEIADADPDVIANAIGVDVEYAECLKICHARFGLSTGRGSWPSGCYPAFSDHHSVTYYTDRDKWLPTFKRPLTVEEIADVAEHSAVWAWIDKPLSVGDVSDKYPVNSILDTALKLCEEAWAFAGCAHVEVASHGDANIHIENVRLPGGTRGIAQFNNRTCGDHVFHRIDNRWTPALLTLTDLINHEGGHNNNLEHEFQDQDSHWSVMSYRNKHPWVGFGLNQDDRPDDESWPELREYYGGEPVPIGPLPPTGDVIIHNGTLKINLFGKMVDIDLAVKGTSDDQNMGRITLPDDEFEIEHDGTHYRFQVIERGDFLKP